MKVGIIGAGTMGSGIAQAFAQAEGYEVYLCDINEEFAANGKKKIAAGFEKRIAKGKMDQAAADAILNKIHTGVKDICTDCDLVVEAALEVMAVKQQTFKELETICKKIYHADGVELTANAKKQAKQLEELGFGNLPICMAKTQYSFSDDPALLGAPTGFTVTVRNLKVSAGAGFIVALTGDIMTMPGRPKVPAAEKIDVDENGVITGLF